MRTADDIFGSLEPGGCSKESRLSVRWPTDQASRASEESRQTGDEAIEKAQIGCDELYDMLVNHKVKRDTL
jgi:hypothetical protein